MENFKKIATGIIAAGAVIAPAESSELQAHGNNSVGKAAPVRNERSAPIPSANAPKLVSHDSLKKSIEAVYDNNSGTGPAAVLKNEIHNTEADPVEVKHEATAPVATTPTVPEKTEALKPKIENMELSVADLANGFKEMITASFAEKGDGAKLNSLTITQKGKDLVFSAQIESKGKEIGVVGDIVQKGNTLEVSNAEIKANLAIRILARGKIMPLLDTIFQKFTKREEARTGKKVEAMQLSGSGVSMILK